jgi:hypothetical protein
MMSTVSAPLRCLALFLLLGLSWGAEDELTVSFQLQGEKALIERCWDSLYVDATLGGSEENGSTRGCLPQAQEETHSYAVQIPVSELGQQPRTLRFRLKRSTVPSGETCVGEATIDLTVADLAADARVVPVAVVAATPIDITIQVIDALSGKVAKGATVVVMDDEAGHEATRLVLDDKGLGQFSYWSDRQYYCTLGMLFDAGHFALPNEHPRDNKAVVWRAFISPMCEGTIYLGRRSPGTIYPGSCWLSLWPIDSEGAIVESRMIGSCEVKAGKLGINAGKVEPGMYRFRLPRELEAGYDISDGATITIPETPKSFKHDLVIKAKTVQRCRIGVQDLRTKQGVVATVSFVGLGGAPVEVLANNTGLLDLDLPGGVNQLRFRADGYQPKILLVDVAEILKGDYTVALRPMVDQRVRIVDEQGAVLVKRIPDSGG